MKRIIIHHSLTKDSKTVSWGTIRKYHKSLGWGNIGYHFGIELARNDYEIFIGRTLDQKGCHTGSKNIGSIGICFVGNYDDVAPPLEMLKTSIPLVRWLMKLYDIPIDEIYGHRNFAKKSCPGNRFDMDYYKELIETFGEQT